MPLRYDMMGQLQGYIEEGEDPGLGYWVRPDYSSDSMSPIQFIEKIGRTRFGYVWAAAKDNADIAFEMMRGLAAQQILITDSFPRLKQLEQTGVLAPGTAIDIWS